MNSSFFELTMAVLNTACVLIVIAYFLIRSERQFTSAHNPENPRDFIKLSLVFGAFSLYAAFNAIQAFDAVVSLRHTGPIVGGFMAGPWVGMVAGFIGAVDRYLQGGPSMPSAVAAVIIAGTMAGLYVRVIKKNRLPSVWEATLFTVFYELAAGLLTFLAVPDFEQALRIEQGIRLPLVIGNAVGVALFIGCVKILARERDISEAKRQIENELNVARSIQMSMVPKIFPTFPAITQFELHAMMRPAKEVGGDLYNFIETEGDRFCFMVGDVSGKGVPASLFMAVAKTLLESEARSNQGQDCALILERTNEGLCRDNHECMFVTVLFGVLNIHSGEVEFCSAGHPLPFVVRRNGEVNQPTGNTGMALGVMEGVPFQSLRLTLAPGDALVLYSDGVSEAFSAAGTMFGEAGLGRTLRRLAADGEVPTAAHLTRMVTEAVDDFADGAPQSDDITILALKYYGLDSPPVQAA